MANTDSILPAELQVAPYYNDYDETKDFYYVNYRPDRAVQGRELNQTQTISQKQVQRLAAGIFQNGSIVTGGEITYQSADEGIRYANLNSSYSGNTIVAADFLGQSITTVQSSNTISTRGLVLTTSEASNTEPATIVFKKISGLNFLQNTTIRVINDTTYANMTATGNASVVSINPGVYFVNGFMARVGAQTIVLDKYDSTPSYRVGLEFVDEIIDENDDTTLLDPAQEASNYQAPGATRYKITLTLSKRTLTSEDDSKFLELLRVEDGVLKKIVKYPQYSELGKTLARRTYDQSGNFTVNPFIAQLLDHVPEQGRGTISITAGTNVIAGSNTNFSLDTPVNSIIIANGQGAIVNVVTNNLSVTTTNNYAYSVASGSNYIVQNPNKFTTRLSPGKGYISGYEFETIAPTDLGVRRARDYFTTSNYNLNSPLGNYLFTTNAYGVPDITNMETFDLHIVQASVIDYTSSNSYQNTKIGTARVRGFEYASATNTSNSLTHTFGTYLFDVSLANSAYTLNSAMALATFTGTGANTFNKRMDISPSSKVNGVISGNTFLTDTNFGCLVYQFPQSVIVPSSITNVDYQYRKFQSNVTVTAGSATVTAVAPDLFIGSGTLSDSTALANWEVTIRNKGDLVFPTWANGQIIPMTSTTGRSIAITSGTSAALSFGAGMANNFTVDVNYTINITGTPPSPRAKTLVNANTTSIATAGATTISNTNTSIYLANGQVHVTNPNNVVRFVGSPQNLYVADIKRLQKVYDFAGRTITQANLASAVDVTSYYTLDNGQRDSYYGQGALLLKGGVTSPSGPLVAMIDYYTHSGTSGFLTVDSYPNASTPAGYADIPVYTSPTNGQLYTLRDCVDWRPIATNAVEGNVLLSPKILEPGQSFASTFSYYVGRVDKIIVTQDLNFKVIEGTPDLYPVPPAIEPNSMLLYTLNIPPYTFLPIDVDVLYNDNKRYTMSDIGRLDRRIQNLEYYTALNLLETAAASTTVVDSNGLARYKNGILVDSFNGHSVGDVVAYDYVCSMDFGKGELRNSFSSNNDTFYPVASGSSNFSQTGNQLTLNYTLEDYLDQPSATGYVAVNLFGYQTWLGTLQLTPDTDTWYSQVRAPQVIINQNGTNDAYASSGSGSNGFGTQWNDWNTTWIGQPTVVGSQYTGTYTETAAGQGYQFMNVTRQTEATPTTQVRTGFATVYVPTTVTQSLGDKVIDQSIIPYIRENDIVVTSNNLRPTSIYYPFLDNTFMLAYWINPTLIQINIPYTGNFFSNSKGDVFTTTAGGRGTIMAQPSMNSIAGNTILPYLVATGVTGNVAVGDTLTGSFGGVATVASVTRLSDNVRVTNANTYQINISTYATYSNTILVGQLISIAKGTGAGQMRTISAYDNVNKTVSLSNALSTAVDTTSVYSIGYPYSSPSGVLVGTLHIPNSNTANFLTGTKLIRMSTDQHNDPTTASSYGDGNYYAQGILQTVQEQILSIRSVQAVQTIVTEERQVTQTNQYNITTPVDSTVNRAPVMLPDGTIIQNTDTLWQTTPAGAQTVIPIEPVVVPCFPEGTKVATPMGPRPIEMIGDGDLVLAFDKSGAIRTTRVNSVIVHEKGYVATLPADYQRSVGIVELTFWSGKTLRATRNHPVLMLEDSVWRKVGFLKVGDLLVNENGDGEMIQTISETLPEETVYNLDLEEYHTYFADGIRVHNSGGVGGSGSSSGGSSDKTPYAQQSVPEGTVNLDAFNDFQRING